MAILASSILSRASKQLLDENNLRWPKPELLNWLNDGQREIVALKPNANTVNAIVRLAAGAKQLIPSAAIILSDIVRNMGVSGTTPGPAIGKVSRSLLADHVPNWASGTASATVQHYMYDLKDPRVFYVYPPQPTGNNTQGQVEMEYCAAPSDVAEDQSIWLDDVYEPALLNYILYRAWSKDAEYAGNVAAAKLYYDAFLAQVTGRVASEKVA